jgi:hypothetical protein
MSHPPPASTAGKLRNVAEEGAVSFGVVAVEEDMSAVDSSGHGLSLSKGMGSALAELRCRTAGGGCPQLGCRTSKSFDRRLRTSAIFYGMSFLSHLHHHHHVHNMSAGVC